MLLAPGFTIKKTYEHDEDVAKTVDMLGTFLPSPWRIRNMGSHKCLKETFSLTTFVCNVRLYKTLFDKHRKQPSHDKINNLVFRPDSTQISLYSHRKWLKKRGGSIICCETKTLISCAVTAHLICAFGFAYMQIVGFRTCRLLCHQG